MGHTTTKIGDNIQILWNGESRIVTGIFNGQYLLEGEEYPYRSSEIKNIPRKPAPLQKNTTPIAKNKKPNQKSSRQLVMDAIYSIVAPKFKLQHPDCEAKLEGCTKKTEDIHHKYKRTGFWLIISKYFLATCRNCHDKITVNSAMAVDLDLSIPRNIELPYEFTEEEIALCKTFEVNLP